MNATDWIVCVLALTGLLAYSAYRANIPPVFYPPPFSQRDWNAAMEKWSQCSKEKVNVNLERCRSVMLTGNVRGVM